MDYISSIRRDTDRLLSAATGNLDKPVRACPEWDVYGLVAHLGQVHRFWSNIVASRRTDPPVRAEPRQPAPGKITALEWLQAGASELCDTLDSTDPQTAVWTWFQPDQSAGWVRRRMAQETAVHRWDAQDAAGAAEPIEAQLAADGIAEFLEVFLTEDDTYAGPAGSVHVHSTDVDGEWTARLAQGRPSVERGHAKADAALRGSASDVLLVLWERRPFDGVEVFGDQPLLRALLDYVDTT